MTEIILKTKRENRSFAVEPNESILFAGLRAGHDIPHECASGTCGTCQALPADDKGLVGRWPQAPGHQHIPEGSERILMCQTACAADHIGEVEPLRVFGPLKDWDNQWPRPDYARAKLSSIRFLTEDVVHLEMDLDRPMDYRAGQFAMLSCEDVAGWRAYSMVAAPASTQRLEFVVKLMPGGGFSKWLVNCVPGSPVRVFGPLGKACLDHGNDGDIVAIAGGSGIAGVLSVLEDELKAGRLETRCASVFFGVRRLEDGFMLDRLENLAKESRGSIAVTLVLSDEAPRSASHPCAETVALQHGFVHEVAGRALADGSVDPADNYYLAGPPVMVDAAIAMLTGPLDVSPTSIRYDRFG